MAMTEAKQAHDDPDRVLGKGLVSGRGDPGGDNGGLVVSGQLNIRGVQVRVVEVGLSGAGLQVVGDGDVRDTAEGGVHLLMSGEPTGLLFILVGVGEDELAEA